MNFKQIQELIKFVAKSGATEVDLEIGDVKICIKSPPKGKVVNELPTSNIIYPVAATSPSPSVPVAPPSVPVAPPSVPVAPPSVESQSINTKPDASKDANLTESVDNQIIKKSPIIGTFYRRPSPDKEPFINVGDSINTGDVVGIVEAMKLFNEIESEVSGTIVKVLVDDMSPVEYDQPLFLVAKN